MKANPLAGLPKYAELTVHAKVPARTILSLDGMEEADIAPIRRAIIRWETMPPDTQGRIASLVAFGFSMAAATRIITP